MPREITIPRLGWSMEEGTLAEWLKSPGEFVRPGDKLFVLESDKASQEIEALDSGRLHLPADAPRPGDTVRVGQVIGFLLAEGEAAPVSVSFGRIDPSASGAATLAARDDEADRFPATPSPTNAKPSIRDRGGVATPRARRRARELGLDWRTMQGSGRYGRVRERDVLAFARRQR